MLKNTYENMPFLLFIFYSVVLFMKICKKYRNEELGNENIGNKINKD
jgi:hypothetical protein